MPQEPLNKDRSKLPRGYNNRPGPGGEDNQPRKGPRFSIYWIYALIFAVLIAFQFWGGLGGNTAEITQKEFKQMVLNQDVSKYLIISNRNIVRVYLKPTSIDKYRDKLKPGTFSSKIDPAGPHFFFQYAGDFEKQMADFNTQNKIPLDQEVPGYV